MSDFQNRVKAFKEKTLELTDKYFPERQIVLRTDGDLKYVCLSKRLQMTVSACAFALFSWTVFTSTTHFMHDAELVEKDKEILSVQVAYRSLLNEVTEYQNKFTNISDELEANHSMLVASIDQETIKNKDKLVSAEAARKEAQIARKHLNRQLVSIEESMRELANRNYSLKGDLSLKEMDLQTALAERNAARSQKERLEEKLRNIEVEMARLNHTQEDLIKRVSTQANEEIADIEEILTLAGLDPDEMLNKLDDDATASGGPFIAASPTDPDTVQDAKTQKTWRD